jgi:tripartite-type tricarboxylate transporter receptor subunit TctC
MLRRAPLLKAMAGLSLALAMAIRPAWAGWPERPVQIIVPYAAGGGTDLTARLLARFLDKHAGGRGVVVVNRTGAGGEIGMAAGAEAPADGYTLTILNTPNLLTIPIERASRFRLDSFVPLANIADDPGTLSVRADSPVRDLSGLIAEMKARPEAVTYGTAGIGSAGHIAMLLVGNEAGVSALHVPYTGSAAVATALLSGDIQVATANFGEAIGYARGGNDSWRILGVMAPARLATHPDIPTFAELGIAVQTGSLRGLGAPRGTPPAVVAEILAALDKVMADPEYQKAMADATQVVRYVKGDAYGTLLRGMEDQLRALWSKTPWNR